MGNGSSSIPVVQELHLKRYLGKWYERARLPAPFQKGGFVWAEYSLSPPTTASEENGSGSAGGDATAAAAAAANTTSTASNSTSSTSASSDVVDEKYETFYVVNSEEKDGSENGRNRVPGVARRLRAEADGHLQVKIGPQPFWGSYDVLDTDYDSYALVYSRISFLGLFTLKEFAWVLMRDSEAADGEVDKRLQQLVQTTTEKCGSKMATTDFIRTPPRSYPK
ncbi:unnamed protein product [Amoebophrya sp. A25]|nr:unnamed protein product [Amoebophrya sp. A25]|eukprot:GSA25T00011600001.1